jgi:osmotically inducible protein OsmC
MKRTATAVWRGGPSAGEGTVKTSSGVIDNVIYTFGSSSIDTPCTNPYEMVTAAEAACVSMMFAKELAEVGIMTDNVEVQAELDVKRTKSGWDRPRINLKVMAHVGEADAVRFNEAAEKAKANCPITRMLNADITIEAVLSPILETVH